MFTILIYILSFLLVALVSGNNLPSCSGPIISSGITTKRVGIAISAAGYMSGFLIEGDFLRQGLLKLMPMQSDVLVTIALGASLAIFLFAHRLRVPQSLTISLTMIIIGIGLAYSGTVNTSFVSTLLGFWIFSVAFCVVATIILMRILRKQAKRWDVWKALGRMRVLLVMLSFLSAFALGANTLGFLYSAASMMVNPLYEKAIVIVALLLGSFFLSSGEIRRIGNEILPIRYTNALVSQSVAMLMVQLGTFLSIPTSDTLTFTASLYGAGLSYKTRLILKRPAFVIVFAWIATALLSLMLGFALTHIIYRPL